jgi:hypothetical protein
MGENCNICSNKCWGSPGYHGSCCSVEDRDYIIGPHHDTDEFILNLSKKFGREIEKEEVHLMLRFHFLENVFFNGLLVNFLSLFKANSRIFFVNIESHCFFE